KIEEGLLSRGKLEINKEYMQEYTEELSSLNYDKRFKGLFENEVSKEEIRNKIRKIQEERRGIERDAEAAREDLTFEEVGKCLNTEIYKSIFHKYANEINPDGEIKQASKNQITCGSLGMRLSDGLWHRFSDGSKGNIYDFVSHAT